MTGDERERILGLLGGGAASVGRLAAGLGLPGGVVSYQLKLLEREGLVRIGGTRIEHGIPIAVYVSTAAAATPPLPAPEPLPGVMLPGEGPYPIPLWTAPPPAPPATADRPDTAGKSAHAAAPETTADRPDTAGEAGEAAAATSTETESAAAPESTAADRLRTAEGSGAAEVRADGTANGSGGLSAADEPSIPPSRVTTRPGHPDRGNPAPLPRRPARETTGRPRLADVRRVPVDEATFYEFARRLDDLAREFAARATPGAPVAELTITLTRPATGGLGS